MLSTKILLILSCFTADFLIREIIFFTHSGGFDQEHEIAKSLFYIIILISFLIVLWFYQQFIRLKEVIRDNLNSIIFGLNPLLQGRDQTTIQTLT